MIPLQFVNGMPTIFCMGEGQTVSNGLPTVHLPNITNGIFRWKMGALASEYQQITNEVYSIQIPTELLRI